MDKKDTIGVVVGRFQIHELHKGHRHLIDHVRARHQAVVVLIGDRTGGLSARDPFPFSIRKRVVSQMYPDVIVLRQMDSPESNEHWSDTLDKKIATVTKGGNAILYGSRDSFIPLYSGAHPTKEVPELPNYSATKARQEALRANPENTEWLKGWLAAVHFQEAVIESTVNSEVGDREEERVSQ